MKIKLKHNQPREKLIFNAKAIANAFECHMSDDIFYYIQDLNISIAQNNHNKLVQAIRGLEGAIATQEYNDLRKATNKLIDMIA